MWKSKEKGKFKIEITKRRIQGYWMKKRKETKGLNLMSQNDEVLILSFQGKLNEVTDSSPN